MAFFNYSLPMTSAVGQNVQFNYQQFGNQPLPFQTPQPPLSYNTQLRTPVPLLAPELGPPPSPLQPPPPGASARDPRVFRTSNNNYNSGPGGNIGPGFGRSNRSTIAHSSPPPAVSAKVQQTQGTSYYKQISAGSGGKTSVHAIIDYDDDFNEHDPSEYGNSVGPISLKNNGSVPVVPKYAYDAYNSNGTLIQIPILWTALSLALGYEVRGDLIRGLPCIKRNHQLFCPTAGNRYPVEEIERFIDENKALVKRMFGEFESPQYGPPGGETFEPYRTKRKSGTKGKSDADWGGGGAAQEGGGRGQSGDPFGTKPRHPRQSLKNTQSSDSGRVDACESKLEIITPYWASNSAGKVRAIVNTQHFEQSVHQETCSKASTGRCAKDCGCEQKYKWHRLMSYDPDNDCKGIFMDWFLFPSCCVCRCNPLS